MAKVEITRSLFEEIQKKFKGESHEIIDILESLEDNPHKGKILTQISGILIKELRYKSFRFYFIMDGSKIKAIEGKELVDLLIKFIAMSDKKDQQKTIEQIKDFLRTFGKEALKD
jgi:hypothetical protein